jgi:multidrug resistance efflux pump
MTTAKVRSLYTRPIRSSDLGFEVAGILGEQNETLAALGMRIPAFDLDSFMRTIKGNIGADIESFNARRISDELRPYSLFSLRSDLAEANLTQLLAQRKIAFLEKYKYIDAIHSNIEQVYPADSSNPESKLNRLLQLIEVERVLRRELKDAYNDVDMNRVIMESVTVSKNTGDSTSTTMVTPVTMRSDTVVTSVSGSNGNATHTTAPSQVIPQSLDPATGKWVEIHKSEIAFRSQETVSANDLTNVSVTRNQEFKHPFYDSLVQEQRNQLNLQDELLAHRMFAHRVPNIGDIMHAELEAIDLEIYKAQTRFIHTFLLSPIQGLVTSIYKDKGEAVNPGEPVVRVDDDSKLLLVGILQSRTPFRVESNPLHNNVRIKTLNIFESNVALAIDGRVVSVRGHESDDDEWDLIIEVANPNQQLPINYHFDRETTTVLFI